MKLPNPDKAVIPIEKVRDYLLSPTHSVGRHKATFFSMLGYNQSDWQVLEQDFQEFLNEDANFIEETDYGKKYEIRGSIAGPNGRSAAVITAWIVLYDEEFARFVTAYPED